MILSRFLASRYAGDGELSLSASLAFEQSYGGSSLPSACDVAAGAGTDMPSEEQKGILRDLGIQESDLSVRSLPSTDPVTVAGILRQERAVQLVLGRDCTLLQEPGAEQLLVALNLPVTVTP